MSAFSRTEKGQKACLEGDTDSEGKVKKVLRNIRAAGPRGQGPSSWVPRKRRPRRGTGDGL